MRSHEGKVAVVTGAARSMGQEIAVTLAARGAKVAGIDLLDCAETESRVVAAGGEFLGVIAELTSEQEVNAAFEAIGDRFGGVDILVNVAGILPVSTIDSTDFALFRKVLDVNVGSMFLTCKAAVPKMRANGWGRIINFGSGIIETSAPNNFAYRTSKAAVLGFTRSLAIDLGGDGITVNTVSPSIVSTPATRESGAIETESFVNQLQVIKRPAKLEDIVGLVSFLASDDAAFVTGQQMHSDGGLVFR